MEKGVAAVGTVSSFAALLSAATCCVLPLALALLGLGTGGLAIRPSGPTTWSSRWCGYWGAHDRAAINAHLSEMRRAIRRDDADRCLPVFPRLRPLRWGPAAARGRLLRVLLLRRRSVPTRSARTLRRVFKLLLSTIAATKFVW